MPPSMNEYWRSRVIYDRDEKRHLPTVYTSGEGKAYQEHVAELITSRRKRYWTPNLLHMKVVVCFGSNGRADPDNRVKPLFDALAKAQFMKDDCQIEWHEVRRGPLVKGGRVIVSCWEILPVRADVLTWVKRPA